MIWLRIKYRLFLIYKTLLLKLGFGKWLLKNRYGERILVFHGIDNVGETKYNSRFISNIFFEDFIKYITTHYNVISLEDYYQKKFKKNTLNIAITFDDGYLNNYKYAASILEKYNVPACFYITTIHKKASYLWADFLDLVSFYTTKKEIIFENKVYKKNSKKEFVNNGISLKNKAKTISYDRLKSLYGIFEEDWNKLPKNELEDYWKLMNEKQITEIADNPLFTIGAHGETHASLIAITLDEAKKEIKNSKNELEKICNKPITEFAFPFGYYNNELANYCLDIGFTKVLLVDYNTKEYTKNNAFKNRFVINPYISMKLQLAYLLKGSYF